jgi:phospholipid/cholesterol/gamma-HCH transport system substrate-binding protein
VKQAIRKHYKDFLAVVLLFVIALVVGGGILSKQRLYLPHWVPIVGSDFVDRKFELATAQALTPGQGQEIAIAGVKVGEINKVELVDGRALVTVKIQRKYDNRIMRDATGLIRPKTGLNDMTIQLDPGTRSAGRAPASYTVPVSQVLPNVNADEILASLDGDTRDYLRMLLSGGGQGLKNNSRELGNTLRRFEPTGRDLAKLTSLLQKRRENISRSIHNFSLLSQAVGEKDAQLAKLVDSSNAVFQAFTREDASLRSTLKLLPGTLTVTRTGLGKADRFARALGPAATRLRPFARALGPSLAQTRPFLRTATPVIQNQLRPFARVSLPVVNELRPAARDLASVTPDLTASLKVLNELFNELAYNPAGKEEGYLFWTAWANHAGMSVFGSQDAHGPIRHGNFLVSCSTLTTLNAVAQANPALGAIVQQVYQQQTLPIVQSGCPGQASPGAGTPPGPATRSKGK